MADKIVKVEFANFDRSVVYKKIYRRALKSGKLDLSHINVAQLYDHNIFAFDESLKEKISDKDILYIQDSFITRINNQCLFDAVTHLCISDLNLSEMPDLIKFINLITLDCSCNNLIEVPPDKIPLSVDRLDCSHNNLVNPINFRLKYLDCSFNSLKKASLHLPFLEELICSHNQITQLVIRDLNYVDINNSSILIYRCALIKLICDNNQIKKLDVQDCELLYYVNCSFNCLQSIKNINLSVTILYCSNNYLSIIQGFSKLIYLECAHNKGILTLAITGPLLKLICCYTSIGSLSEFPISLTHIDLRYSSYEYMFILKDICPALIKLLI